jgi:hypothetical protein
MTGVARLTKGKSKGNRGKTCKSKPFAAAMIASPRPNLGKSAESEFSGGWKRNGQGNQAASEFFHSHPQFSISYPLLYPQLFQSPLK